MSACRDVVSLLCLCRGPVVCVVCVVCVCAVCGRINTQTNKTAAPASNHAVTHGRAAAEVVQTELDGVQSLAQAIYGLDDAVGGRGRRGLHAQPQVVAVEVGFDESAHACQRESSFRDARK